MAYPASYGLTGVVSFLVSHDGDVYQKDLGPKSEELASAMIAFDPDESWQLVPEQ